MKAQMAVFSIDPSQRASIEALAENWSAGAGTRLDGCENMTIAFEEGGSNKVSVELRFRDQEALDTFSADQETMNIVKQLGDLVGGKLEYYEGTATSKALV